MANTNTLANPYTIRVLVIYLIFIKVSKTYNTKVITYKDRQLPGPFDTIKHKCVNLHPHKVHLCKLTLHFGLDKVQACNLT